MSPISPAAPGAVTKDWLEYVTDAYQRGVLYLDVLRRRGNEEEEITARPMATVLHFDHEVLMSGRSFRKPINFALSRIVPPRAIDATPAEADLQAEDCCRVWRGRLSSIPSWPTLAGRSIPIAIRMFDVPSLP